MADMEFSDHEPLRRRLDDEEFVPGTDALVIRATLRVYGTAFLVMLFTFCILRKRYPKLFHVRRWSPFNDLQCALAQKDYGFISWMWVLYRTTDEELLDQCGMDALCFLRILHFGFKVSCLGIFNSFWLLPVYATAKDSEETQAVQDPVEELTTSHVPSESRRFIGTVVGAYILFLTTMYLILKEFEWYTKNRQTFLSKRAPRNYAVYVTGIPEEYRSSSLLFEYFLGCFTRHAVLEAHVAMDIPNLNKLVASRANLILKLEHALAIKHIRGHNPTHRSVKMTRDLSKLDFTTVDSIEAYERDLQILNVGIRDGVKKLLPRPQTLERSQGHRIGENLVKMPLSPLSPPLSPRSSFEEKRNRLNSEAMQIFPDFSKSPTSDNGNARARLNSEAMQLFPDYSNASPSKEGRKRLASNALQIFRDMTPRKARSKDRDNEAPKEKDCDIKLPDLDDYRCVTIDDGGISRTKLDRFPSEIIDVEAGRSVAEESLDLQSIHEDTQETERRVNIALPPAIERAPINDEDYALRQWNDAMSLTSPASASASTQQKRFNFASTRKSSELDEIEEASAMKQANDSVSLPSNQPKSVTLSDQSKIANARIAAAQSLGRLPRPTSDAMQGQEVVVTDEQFDDSSVGAAEDAMQQWNEALRLTTGVSKPLEAERCNMQNDGDWDIPADQRDDSQHSVQYESDISRSQLDQESTVSEVHATFQRASTLASSSQASAHSPLPLESRITNQTAADVSCDSDTHSEPIRHHQGVTHTLFRARDTITNAIVGQSNNVVKVVTGNSTDVVARNIGDAAKEVNVDNLLKIGEHGVDGIKSVAKYGFKNLKNVQQAGQNAVMEAVDTAVKIFNNEDGDPREAGFVVFKKLSTTQAALGMIHNSTPYVMNVEEAPEPDDIYWQNVGKTHRARQLGSILSFAASAALCFFWTIPVSFISSLTEVDSLKQTVPFLGNMIENHPWIEPALAQIAPLMLIILNLLLPAILGYFAKMEGHIASSSLDASVFVKLSVFQIIQTFFVSAISGGVYAQLAQIIDEPGALVVLLANSLPTQGTFFVQILLVTTFIGQGVELLRIAPLLLAFLRSRIGPNLTRKERSSIMNEWLRPLSNPRPFEHAEVFANTVLYFMVIFVYAVISPVISYFVAGCFLIMGAGYRYQFIHNYPSTPDSGGKLWSGFIGICMAAMIIAQLTLVGLLALKKAAYATPCMVPLIIITVIFTLHLRVKHFRVANALPTNDCMQLDKKRRAQDFHFVQGQYLQPSLRARDLYPEVEDVGIGANLMA